MALAVLPPWVGEIAKERAKAGKRGDRASMVEAKRLRVGMILLPEWLLAKHRGKLKVLRKTMPAGAARANGNAPALTY